jgi:superfamily II DNA/RNA helicase
MEQGHLSLSHLEHFVLDEADRMLDMGFLPDLEKIISDLPEQRQSLFFSATLAPKITELAQGLLRDPVSINIAPEKRSLDQIEQFLTEVKTSEKIDRLTEILTSTDVRRAIVFIRTKRNTSKVEKKLSDAGLPVGSIHGDKSQNARQRTLMAFRRGKINILVATDVAARGIDVDDVSHVINFDLPEDAETYVHRIGRTGRAGAKGTAITFYTAAQRRDVREIERYLGNETDADPTVTGPKQGGGRRKKGQRGGKGPRPPRKEAAKPRSRTAESRRGAARNVNSPPRETHGKPKRFEGKSEHASKTRRQGFDSREQKSTGDREKMGEQERGTNRSVEKPFGGKRFGGKPTGGNRVGGKRRSDRRGSEKRGGSKRTDSRRTDSRRSEDVSPDGRRPDGSRPTGKRPIRASQSDSRQDGRRKPRAKSPKGSRLETGSQGDSRGNRSDYGRSDNSKPESGERRKKRKDGSKPSKKPQKRRAKKASYHFTEEFINQVKKAQKFRNRKKATKKAKPKRG